MLVIVLKIWFVNIYKTCLSLILINTLVVYFISIHIYPFNSHSSGFQTKRKRHKHVKSDYPDQTVHAQSGQGIHFSKRIPQKTCCVQA